MAKVDFLTPVGRLVGGNPWKPETTDINGKQMVIQSGPNAGQPTQVYLAHIAVAKNDPEATTFYAKLIERARAEWPQYVDAAGNVTHPKFSLKFTDGDGPDGNGQSQAHKEGYAGHWIIKTASAYPPRVFYRDHYAPHEEVKEPNALKRGYFVRIGGQIDSNGFPSQPGLKLYCGQIAIWAQGPEITSGPDAATVFGSAGQGMALPGMQALPAVAPPVAGALVMPGAAAAPLALPGLPGGTPTGQPAAISLPGTPASALPAAMPGLLGTSAAPVLVTPNPGLMAGAAALPGLPGQAAAMPGLGLPGLPPALPAGPTLTALGQSSGMTYQQMLTAGYTEAQLRQAGYIV